MPYKDRDKQLDYFRAYNAERSEARKPWQRSYYEKYGEKIKARQKKQYHENPQLFLARAKSYREKNKDRLVERQRREHVKNPLARMLLSAKVRARKQNVEFTLTKHNINMPKRCPVLGIELRISNFYNDHHSPTIDRINPFLGYTPENCRVISWRANRLKSDGTEAEFEAILAYVQSFNG